MHFTQTTPLRKANRMQNEVNKKWLLTACTIFDDVSKYLSVFAKIFDDIIIFSNSSHLFIVIFPLKNYDFYD